MFCGFPCLVAGWRRGFQKKHTAALVLFLKVKNLPDASVLSCLLFSHIHLVYTDSLMQNHESRTLLTWGSQRCNECLPYLMQGSKDIGVAGFHKSEFQYRHCVTMITSLSRLPILGMVDTIC